MMSACSTTWVSEAAEAVPGSWFRVQPSGFVFPFWFAEAGPASTELEQEHERGSLNTERGPT